MIARKLMLAVPSIALAAAASAQFVPAGAEEEAPPEELIYVGGLRVGASFGGATPVGKFGDSNGFGFGGGVRVGWDFPVKQKFSLEPGIGFSYFRYGGKDDSFGRGPGPVARTILLNPGLRAYLRIKKLMPFLDVNFGVANVGLGEPQDFSENKFNVGLGAGADYWVSSRFALGLFVNYGIIFKRLDRSVDEGSSSTVRFGLDTNFRF